MEEKANLKLEMAKFQEQVEAIGGGDSTLGKAAQSMDCRSQKAWATGWRKGGLWVMLKKIKVVSREREFYS